MKQIVLYNLRRYRVDIIDGICELPRRNGLGWHDMHTKFYETRFRHSGNIKISTSNIWEAEVLVLLIGWI
jgi:hypothetical protein